MHIYFANLHISLSFRKEEKKYVLTLSSTARSRGTAVQRLGQRGFFSSKQTLTYLPCSKIYSWSHLLFDQRKSQIQDSEAMDVHLQNSLLLVQPFETEFMQSKDRAEKSGDLETYLQRLLSLILTCKRIGTFHDHVEKGLQLHNQFLRTFVRDHGVFAFIGLHSVVCNDKFTCMYNYKV